jgi:rubredoxin
MPRIVAYEDVTADQIIRNRGADEDHPSADVYPFIGQPRTAGVAAGADAANAFLVRYLPGTRSSTHYHAADQMQIIVEGKGWLGQHDMVPYQVHFARAYTPYGPLVPDAGEGWAFVNLRTREDAGAQRLSVSRDKLLAMKDRRPFQVSCEVAFPKSSDVAELAAIAGLDNEAGLRGYALTLPPHGRHTAPSAAHSDGQYIVVVEGSLVSEGRVRNALAIVHLKPDEPPFEIEAGASGLRAMILNFPSLVEAEPAPTVQVAVDTAHKVWTCLVCDFSYDEAAGMPEDGIAPGTRWADVPDAWSCPDCGVTKADFVMVDV